jgi:hypothetical protein
MASGPGAHRRGPELQEAVRGEKLGNHFFEESRRARTLRAIALGLKGF